MQRLLEQIVILVWEKKVPTTGENSLFSQIIEYLPDSYLLLGTIIDPIDGKYSTWLYQIDDEGNMLSSEIVDHMGEQYPLSLLFDSKNAIFVCGIFSQPSTSSHMGLMKIPPLRIDMIDSIRADCGSLVELTPDINYVGNSPLHYSWSPNKNIDPVDSLATNIQLIGDSKTYFLTVSDGTLLASDSVYVEIENHDYSVLFSVDHGTLNTPPFIASFENISPNLELYDFLWLFGDGDSMLSNEHFVSHEYLYNGYYDVTLVASNKLSLCSDSTSVENYISCSGGDWATNVSNVNNYEIAIYPNSAKHSMNMEFDNRDNKSHQLVIYDCLGRQVLMKRDITASHLVLDLDKFHSGIYYFMLTSEDEKQGAWGKFIVE